MKKIISLLFTAIVVAIIIFSCNKEIDKTTGTVSTIDDSQLNSLVLNFIEQMEANKNESNYKSGSSMSIDSAVWYMESTMNFMYCFSGTPYFNIQWDTVYVDLQLSSQNVAHTSDVLATFDEAVQNVKEKYINIEKDKKWLIVILVQDAGPSSQTGFEKLRVIAQTGFDEPVYSGIFDEEDDWYFLKDSYTCDGIPPYGAPNELEGLLIPCYNDCCVYWWKITDIIEFNDPTAYPADQENPDNYLDYKLFYAIDNSILNIIPETECLEYNPINEIHEMQFYLDNAQDLIDESITEHQGKLHFTTKMESFDQSPNYLGRTIRKIGMKMTIELGIRHARPEISPYPINIANVE